MGRTIIMDNDRLFASDPTQRQIARRLYGEIKDLPIINPHGHTDPRWYAENTAFPDPAALFLIPDHYLFRMLYSRGVPLEKLGIPRADGGPVETDPRKIWRLFAEHYHLFRGTPSRMWLEHVFYFLFGIDQRLDPANADEIYDRLAAALLRPEFKPRALYDRFNIEALATTDSPLDSLEHHHLETSRLGIFESSDSEAEVDDIAVPDGKIGTAPYFASGSNDGDGSRA